MFDPLLSPDEKQIRITSVQELLHGLANTDPERLRAYIMAKGIVQDGNTSYTATSNEEGDVVKISKYERNTVINETFCTIEFGPFKERTTILARINQNNDAHPRYVSIPLGNTNFPTITPEFAIGRNEDEREIRDIDLAMDAVAVTVKEVAQVVKLFGEKLF